MKRDVTNVSHSIRQRLLNEARKSGQPFQDMLTLYAIERFLYRVGHSRYVEKFYLKGALLLTIWGIPKGRPTADIDMLGKIDTTDEALKETMAECMTIDVDDGLTFHPETITIETITKDADYDGKRIRFLATLGTARAMVQVDVGIGDIVIPGPIWIDYPVLLKGEKPHLLAYTPESSIAEKFHAMVKLDMGNSRMKDFYDVWLLSEHLEFDGEILSNAIRSTFERRETEISGEIPVALTDRFAADDAHQKQWQAFLRKNELEGGTPSFEEIQERIAVFLMPPANELAQDNPFSKKWFAGSDWK